ncbi:MAG: NADH-quinone oxidoreductase subunit C [Acidimicrobiales bacterium]
MSESEAPADEPGAPDGETAEEGAGAESAYGCPVSWSRSQRVIHPGRDQWSEVMAELLADGWDMCVDVTSVDYLLASEERVLPPGVTPERFEVVASFVSYARRERLRARVQVPGDDPVITSLYTYYPGTDFMEREVYDLMGIVFDGHPDLSRILMPESWDGHPLRKDYSIGSIPVQFTRKGAQPASGA